jgi:hypothetical protein
MSASSVILKGQDTADGLTNWVKKEMADGPSRRYDLGKFFFTVTSATFGILAIFEKLNDQTHFSLVMIFGIFALGVSIFISLLMVLPREIRIPNGDIMKAYLFEIKSFRKDCWLWFVVWVLGALTSIPAAILRY